MTKPQTALITGASGGIGLELATAAAQHGHDLLLVARSAERLEMIAKNLSSTYNVKATAVAMDLGTPGAAAELAKKVARKQIDILINNAGFGLGGTFIEQDSAKLNDMITLNITTLTELTRLLAPKMVARGMGRIMNVASSAAYLPLPGFASYAATKAYVLSFSVSLNQELSGTGVTATVLCPGATQTGFASTANLDNPSDFGRGALSATEVAQKGYKGMLAGKAEVKPGYRSQLAAVAGHLFSKPAIAKVAARRIKSEDHD